MNAKIQAMVRDIPSMGSYAGVINEVERVLANPESSINHISEVIEKDPDLTSRLLKLGNSSFYSFPNRLATVQEAITLIGIQQVYDLLLASNILEVFAGVAAEFVTMRSFWQHSLACGVLARLLALDRQLPKPDKFFVAGLLHDVGRLVLFSRAPGDAVKVFNHYQQERCLLREAEINILGFDHATIGESLLKYWNYPANLVNAVGYHHHPLAAEFFQVEASVVHVADFLVHAIDIGSSGENFIPPLKMPAWEKVNFSVADLATLMDAADDQIEAVENAFLAPPPSPLEEPVPSKKAH
jgi:HD-like signal output (HDOD) protein